MDSKKKNGAFSDDGFEDIFSASADGGFEDIFSDSASAQPDAFEDISSGRTDTQPTVRQDDPYAGFFEDDAFADAPQETPVRTPVNRAPEKKPYRYNENTPARTRARNGDEIVSGKPVSDKPKKKHIGLKVFCVILAVILLLAGGAGLYGYSKVQALLGAVNSVPLAENKYISEKELFSSPHLQNILLIGVDARSGENAEKTRSDTMLLVTIDSKNKQIKLTSFLRDLYVEIPGYREDKLNAAQSHGGTQLLVDTLEYNFRIRIDNYALVSFEMFTTIIDKLGGVDVAVTKREANYINSRDHMTAAEKAAFPEKISEGVQHFDGAQALWYSRIRYLDSDFMRTGRQRKVITALAKKAVEQSPSELLALAQEIMPMVQTGLSQKEMTALGLHALSYLQYDIVQQQIPAEDAYKSGKRRGMSVLLPDLEKNRTVLRQFLSEKAVTEDTTE